LEVRGYWVSRMCGAEAELLQSGRELTTKVENNLDLSSCAVPRSAVIYVVVLGNHSMVITPQAR